MMDEEIQAWRNNVAALIVDDGGNLLLGGNLGDSTYWHVPQGGVRKKETLREAVLREVQEEVGLGAEQLRVLASVGGFRYRYRHKNRKSAFWAGQQQSYFLLRCQGLRPPTDTADSAEFSEAVWMPWQKVTPDMFVSFKREVMARVLQLFSPQDGQPWEEGVAHALTTQRYWTQPNMPWADPRETTLFAGEKEGVEIQMADLRERLARAQQQQRLRVLIMGGEGSGKVNCLRNIARCLDPLYTRALPPEETLPFGEAFRLMEGRYVQMLASSAYDSVVAECRAGVPDWQQHAAQLCQWEEQLQADGVPVVKIFLHTSWKEACKRHSGLEDEGMSAWGKKQEAYRHVLAATGAWYVIPSDHRWYRNYIAARIVTEALER